MSELETATATQDNTDAAETTKGSYYDAMEAAHVEPTEPTIAPAEGEQDASEALAGDVVPEEYEAFTAPEGFVEDAEVMGEFKAYAKELGLPQEKAQQAFDIGMKMAEKVAETVKGQYEQAWAKTSEAWEAAVKADKELGGSHLDETSQRANRIVERFGSPELVDLMNRGFGNNPEIVRMLVKIDKAMSEDTTIGASGGAGGNKQAGSWL